jgi:hypothetical protein
MNSTPPPVSLYLESMNSLLNTLMQDADEARKALSELEVTISVVKKKITEEKNK